jgi:hypothetical protein
LRVFPSPMFVPSLSWLHDHHFNVQKVVALKRRRFL